eukprot:7388829-Prymnesium_polylepis.1
MMPFILDRNRALCFVDWRFQIRCAMLLPMGNDRVPRHAPFRHAGVVCARRGGRRETARVAPQLARTTPPPKADTDVKSTAYCPLTSVKNHQPAAPDSPCT